MPHAIAAYPEAATAVSSLRDHFREACRRQEPIEFNFGRQLCGFPARFRTAGSPGPGEKESAEKNRRQEKPGGAELPFTPNENCSWQRRHFGLLLHFTAFSRHGLRAAAEWGRCRNLAFDRGRHDGGNRRFSLQQDIKG
jgi:hypothetical protein